MWWEKKHILGNISPWYPPPISSSKVVLLSATMPSDVLEVTKKFMRDPIRILVKKEELTLEGIRQFYINVEREVGPVWEVALGVASCWE